MSMRSFVGKFVIVLAPALSACAPAQQGGVTPGSGAAAGQVNQGPQKDPNLPPLTGQTESNVPIVWTYGVSTKPSVFFKNPAAECEYLGFDEKGSLIRNEGNGKVYRWNLKENSLTVVANNFKEVPLDVFASLQNAPQSVQYWLTKNGRGPQPATIPQQQGGATSGSGAAAGQVNHGLQPDPNFPPLSSQTESNVPLNWSYHSATRPTVHFKIPAAEGDYLGFNDQASLVQNQGNGKVYVWNLKTNSLTVLANNINDVPTDVLESLKNTNQEIGYLLTKRGVGPRPQPVTVAGGNPPPQPPQPNPFGNDARDKLAGLAPATGSPYDITGKGASVQGGILTFTLADGSRSMPYKVARPGFMANAPQAAGIAGAWIAMEDGGKGIMFSVQADNTVTGKEIPPQVVQMLMRGATKPQ